MSKELPGLLFLLAGCTRRKTLRRIWVPQVPVFAPRDFDTDVFYVNAPPILDFAYNFSVGTARALLKGQSIAQTRQRSHLHKPLQPFKHRRATLRSALHFGIELKIRALASPLSAWSSLSPAPPSHSFHLTPRFMYRYISSCR
jgi:hypothetical protein